MPKGSKSLLVEGSIAQKWYGETSGKVPFPPLLLLTTRRLCQRPNSESTPDGKRTRNPYSSHFPLSDEERQRIYKMRRTLLSLLLLSTTCHCKQSKIVEDPEAESLIQTITNRALEVKAAMEEKEK